MALPFAPPRAASIAATLSRPLPMAIILLVAATVARRVFFMATESDRDVGLYALQAREWLRGGWPYVAVWDIHSLGEPALAAAMFALVGEGVVQLRLLGAITVAASGFLLARLVAAHLADRALGLATGLTYVAYTTLSGGLAPNNEVVMGPFVVGGVALAIGTAGRLLDNGTTAGAIRGNLRVADVLLPGLCFGVALWIKQVVAPEAMATFGCLVLLALWRRRLRWAAIPILAVVFALACAGPTLLTGLAYAARGEFAEFYGATIVAPLRYGEGGRTLWLVPGAAKEAALRFAPLLLLGVIGVVSAIWRWRGTATADRLLAMAALIWFAAACLGVLMPPTPFGHHFLIVLPPLALLAALGVRGLMAVGWAPGHRLPATIIAIGIAGFVAAAPLAGAVFQQRAAPKSDLLLEVARTVRAGLAPGAAIYVVNANPVVYVLAGAGIPTRYVFPDHLAGRNAVTIPGLDPDAEIARILATRPQYLVLDRDNWVAVREPAKRLITAALESDYGLVATLTERTTAIDVYRRRPRP